MTNLCWGCNRPVAGAGAMFKHQAWARGRAGVDEGSVLCGFSGSGSPLPAASMACCIFPVCLCTPSCTVANLSLLSSSVVLLCRPSGPSSGPTVPRPTCTGHWTGTHSLAAGEKSDTGLTGVLSCHHRGASVLQQDSLWCAPLAQ